MNKNSVIEQTAKDYDMDYEDVERIFNQYHPKKFYDKLEEFIKNRKNGGE